MKNYFKKIGLLAASLLLVGWSGAIAQHDHSQKQEAAQTGHQQHGEPVKDMSQIKPQGQLLGEKKVQGFSLSYFLLDMKERNEMLKGHGEIEMPGISKSPDVTNHLMIYIKGADSKFATGKVGFSITGPDAKDFKTMTMGMYNGYGADVILKAKGVYKIKTKAVIGDKTINDELEYEVK